MKAYLANTFADEDGPMAVEGKTVYIQASKEQLMELSAFFAEVANHVQESDLCHMHFMDHAKNWNKEDYIDVSVDLLQNE